MTQSRLTKSFWNLTEITIGHLLFINLIFPTLGQAYEQADGLTQSHALVIWRPLKSPEKLVQEIQEIARLEWRARVQNDAAVWSDPDLKRRLRIYKKRLGLPEKAAVHLSPKEKNYLEIIIQSIKQIGEYLQSANWQQEHNLTLDQLRHQIYEMIYDFVTHRPKQAKADLEKSAEFRSKSASSPDQEYRDNCQRQNQLLHSFSNRKDIKECLRFLENECPLLPERRPTLGDLFSSNLGPYLSVTDPSQNDYLVFVLEIASVLRQPIRTQQDVKIAAAHLVKLSKSLKGLLYYPEEIEGLSFLAQILCNINTPIILQSLSEPELTYLRKQMGLMGFAIPKYVHYSFLSLSIQQIEEAKKKLSKHKKGALTPNQEEAQELLLHANIPWKHLQSVGIFSLETSKSKNLKQQQIFQEALIELMPEISKFLPILNRLLEYKVQTYLGGAGPTVCESADLTFLPMFGYYQSDLANLRKMHTSLGEVKAFFVDPNDVTLSHRYALLRVLEIVGEGGKNLSPFIKKQNTEFWKKVTDLRDLLSHLERPSIAKRLEELLSPAENARFYAMAGQEATVLLSYFAQQIQSLDQLSSWQQIKDFYQTPSSAISNLNGLKTILELGDILDSPLLLSERRALLQSLGTRDQSAANLKQSVFEELVTQTIQSSRVEFSEKVKKLPISEADKKTLDEYHKHLSPEAWEKKKSGQIKDILKTLPDEGEKKTLIAELLEGKFQLDKDAFFKIVEDLKIKKQSSKDALKVFYLYLHGDPSYRQDELKEVQAIIERIPVYTDGEALEKVLGLINSFSSFKSRLWEKFEKELKEIGITDTKAWETQHKKLVSSSASVSGQQENSYKQALKQLLSAAKAIKQNLQVLDGLTEGYRNVGQKDTLKRFNDSRLLYYGCEHVLASFREQARNLFDKIDFLKSYKDCDFDGLALHQLLTRVKTTLQGNIFQGNARLHLHDTTEADTVTPFGYTFQMYQELIQLLDGIPYGQFKTQKTLSFAQELSFCIIYGEALLEPKKRPRNILKQSALPLYNLRTGLVRLSPISTTQNPDGTTSMSFGL